jgi:hypothetical protein
MSEEVRLERTGKAALRFRGELVAEASSHFAPGRQERTRWHELRLYRTDGGRHILAIGYQTRWQGEHAHSEAEAVRLSALGEYLDTHNPLASLVGYPSRPEYDDRQAQLEQQLAADFAVVCGELLAAIPEADECIE